MRTRLVAGAWVALMAAAGAQEVRVSPAQTPSWVLGGWPQLIEALAPDAPAMVRSHTRGIGQSLAAAGREDLVAYDTPPHVMRQVCQPLLREGRPVEPLAYIVDAAREAPITMIGEAHAEPQTRHFIGQLAARLRSQGYTAYAAETFNPQIAAHGPAIPLLSDGGYSHEAVYGRVIRQLRDMDYRLLPYEADGKTIDPKLPSKEWNQQREILQAANLAALVRRESGKILVHPGMGHHAEFHRPDSNKLMGTIFAETTGINPLTINLIAYEAPAGAAVVCDPAAFKDQPPSFDIRIGMPKQVFERGRPRWRIDAGDRFAEIPVSLRRAGHFSVYEARPAGERVDSTPMDRLLLRPGENLPLLLPPGRYDLSVWTERDGWSAAQTLVVAAN